VRRGNGVVLTADGEQLLKHVQPILAGLDATRDALDEQAGQSRTLLSVATNLRVLDEEIAWALARFQKRRPDVRLRLTFTSNDVDAWIADGRADVGFTLEPAPEDSPQLSVMYEGAGEVDYLLVMQEEHALASRRSLRLAQIAEERLVLAHEAAYSRRRVEEVFHRHNLTGRLSLAVVTSSDEYTLPCVRAGLGVGITVGRGRGPLYQGLAVRPLRRWFGTARLGFFWKRGAPILTPQRELAEAIREAVELP
jgi:DNA-binding transcriptional LysR family regulator